MAWCRIGDKPLKQYWTDSLPHICALGGDELILDRHLYEQRDRDSRQSDASGSFLQNPFVNKLTLQTDTIRVEKHELRIL